MTITEMHIQGPAASAVIRRPAGGGPVEVEIALPGGPRRHTVQPGDRQDLWSMAQCLQETLDGVRGCGGDVRGYFLPLELMSDL
jgi:hypothetical protein